MSPLLILEMGMCAPAAVSAERLLALLIIKLKPLTSVDTSRSAVLRCVPGHRLACSVGLLRDQCNCRSFTGQESVLPPSLPSSAGIIKAQKTQWRAHRFIHAVWSVFSCKWWNWKRLNSLTWFANIQGAGIPLFSCTVPADYTLFAWKLDAQWVLPGCYCWLYITFLQLTYAFTTSL